MQQARSWDVATLNELRKFFKLQPHDTFEILNSDSHIKATLEELYDTTNSIELYPGLIAENAALPDTIRQGLCHGSTMTKAILLNIVALVRGDRYYTLV